MARRSKKGSVAPAANPASGSSALPGAPGAGVPGIPGVRDYRHPEAKRKNNPPAKIAAEGTVPIVPKAQYSYSPRRPPTLRFDPSGGGKPDKLPELLATARQRALTADEAAMLAEALRTQEPWLEWANKLEQNRVGLTVDPVALHIHERVSTQAILKVAARQDVERTLFGDPEQAYHEAVQFYRHDIDWTNRLILGDSLQVMSSLARREDLAGKVQMIYMDPPYGIKFASNFQPEVGKRDVKDKETDLTREPEMVKAYRDTWHLGIHSYLSYLRDRLIAARELLADTGSIFIQISDENLHRVRSLLDEVFGPENFCGGFAFVKTAGQTSELVASVMDHLLWYARKRPAVRFNRVFQMKVVDGEITDKAYNMVELPDGHRRRQTPDEVGGDTPLPAGARPFQAITVVSQSLGRAKGEGAACWFPVEVDGRSFLPTGGGRWRTNEPGMTRMRRAERLTPAGDSLRQIRYIDDFPAFPVTTLWRDTGGGLGDDKMYSVQTATKVIERCMLMTTDPGDLVLDPTCGSGTTAYVAEQWGRRWITIDTSRVAVAIARQRILTAKFDYFKLRDEKAGVAGNFRYKTVAHITLKSIAQNQNLDPIFARHEPVLDARLVACNAALAKVTADARRKLEAKLIRKQREEGKKAVTDADRRRWELPAKGVRGWEHWQVPFDTDPDWPAALAEAVTAYRAAWRAKMDEVNACIAANAEQEELVDQPEVAKGVVRVSGPFTVEAVQPPEMSLGDVFMPEDQPGFAGEPGELPRFSAEVFLRPDLDVHNVEAYLDQMLRLLKTDGVRFPNNKQMRFSRLERVTGSAGTIHAEGRWVAEGEADADAEGKATVAVVFGPQYGPITAKQVEDALRAANRRGYADLVLAGFSFDGAAQAVLDEDPNPGIRAHMAHIRPDVNPGMAGLLKEQPGSQLFTVFGQPRTRVDAKTPTSPDDAPEYVVTMEGVDIYNPVDNSVTPTGADKVAAWFLDGDYDGRTFCITQAFFPDRNAWEKLAKALGGSSSGGGDGVVDPHRFEALSGTVSLPFPAGKHKTVAVKVIDPRGNEVMRVHRLG